MHTEKEARTKWCPFARYLSIVYAADRRPVAAVATNQGVDEKGERVRSVCIASDCMAWRWAGWRVEEVVPPTATTQWQPTTHAQKPKGADDAVRLGYCGLAGQHDD